MKHFLRNFIRDEQGSISVFWYMMLILFISFSSLVVNNAYRIAKKNSLQPVADTTALVAAQQFASDGNNNINDIKNRAFLVGGETFNAVMNTSNSNVTLEQLSDIKFGRFNRATQEFIEDPNAKQAAMVTIKFDENNGTGFKNAAYNFFANNFFGLEVGAIAEAYYPDCVRHGVLARLNLTLSEVSIGAGACVYGGKSVSLKNGFTVSPTATITTAQVGAILPNPITEPALAGVTQYRSMDIRPNPATLAEDVVTALVSGVGREYDRFVPSYINSSEIIRQPTGSNHRIKEIKPSHLTPNRIHHQRCGSKGRLFFTRGTYQNVVILTNCQLRFAGGVVIKNAMVVTTNGWSYAIDNFNTLTLGGSNCNAAGGAVLIAKGGAAIEKIRMARSQLILGRHARLVQGPQIYGSTILANENLKLFGRPIIEACPNSQNSNRLEQPYFRIVR